jgi:hypothetical protein
MSVTPEEAAAALGAEVFKCPDCGKPFSSALKVRLHQGAAHMRKREGQAAKPGRVAITETQAREEIDRAVGHMIGIGSVMAGTGLAVHLGVTIAGVQNEKGEWVVRSRAMVAGQILFEQAKHNARVLEFVIAFNRFMAGSELADVAGSVVAAAAADVGVPSDVAVGFNVLGRPVQFQPIRMAIGDVVDFIQAEMPSSPQPAAAGNGAAPPRRARSKRATVVEGGVTAT